MSSSIWISLANHLWQSTLFAGIAGGLTLLVRKSSARVRYSLWLAASAKFLIPFALLTAAGAHIPWSLGRVDGREPSLLSFAGQMAAQITQFGGGRATALSHVAHARSDGRAIAIALGVVWALGTLAVVARWLARWSLVRRALRESTESSVSFVVPVRSSRSQLEPAIVGVLRPVLVLPHGMEHRLTPEEMHAVLAHERCHVAWRDNLAAALHMLVEALFWFHPLIWWLGTRLVTERERACDEQVLADGHSCEMYAEGILKVCEHYLEARLACVCGVSGANLGQRIESILQNRLIERVSGARKMVIAVAAGAMVAVPIAVGILTAPQVRAQGGAPDTDELDLRNVSIRLAPPGAGITFKFSFRGHNGELRYPTLRQFIADAYGVAELQVVGRDWSRERAYEITADVTAAGAPTAVLIGPKYSTMIRDLLAQHCGLIVRQERKRMDGYVLRIGSGGSKLTPKGNNPPRIGFTSGFINAKSSPLSFLVQYLQFSLEAPVADQTGLQGRYDYKVTWKRSLSPRPVDPAAVTKPLEEQLGLDLQAKRLTVDMINVVSLTLPAS